MTKFDIQDEVYDCPKIEMQVVISCMVDTEISDGADNFEIESIPIDCDHKRECGVVIKSALNVIEDWRKCVHPELKDDSVLINIEGILKN
jgi:hypothetical protein